MKNLTYLSAAAALAAVLLAGCEASGNGNSDLVTAGINGDGSGSLTGGTGIDSNGNQICATGGTCSTNDTGFPNDGSVGGPTMQDQGGTDTLIAGTGADPNDPTGLTVIDSGKRFVCTDSMNIVFGASTEVGTNQLVGDTLIGLLNQLGGQGVTQLLDSVQDKDNVIDGQLTTAAAFNFTAGALNLLLPINSVDLNVYPPAGTVVDAGKFAVFAVSFPPGLVDAGLQANVSITTYLNGVQQEPTVTYNVNTISLLAQDLTGNRYGFVGRKVTKPYDRAVISLGGNLLTAFTGDAMYAHELCVDGTIVNAAP